MSEGRNRRILIVDDNPDIHRDFRKILLLPAESGKLKSIEAEIFGQSDVPPAKENYYIDSAYQGQEAVELVRRSKEADRPYSLAFVDMRMPPGWDGLQTIEKIWELDDRVQVIICTAYSDSAWDVINKKLNGGDRLLILKKPFDMVEVCQLACALTEKWHLAQQANLKVSQLKAMVEEQTRELAMNNQFLRNEIEQRRFSENRYRLAETGSNDGLWDWDLQTGKVYYSTRWKSMLGWSEEEIGDSPQEWLGRVHPEDLPRLRADQQEHIEGRTQQLRGEYRLMHRDGEYRWMMCRGVAARNEQGLAVRAAGSFTDITDRKTAEDQLRHEALHDALTGLANRVRLTNHLGHCLARSRRDSSFRFALLFMDMDHFKVINDSLGHLIGDKLLVEVGRRLMACAREVDVVARPGQDQVARIGGDEFVLLLEGLRDQEDALRVAERVHKALAVPFKIEGHDVFTFVSIGITFSDARYQRADDMLRDADTALYEAKASGKACTRIFDPAMHDRAVTRFRTETELRHAIEHDELLLYFQPILTAAGELASLEALVRWQHPTRGMLPPDSFIPIAEETGLIIPLGRYVMRAACKQLRKWQVRFPGRDQLAVAVNVSQKQFAMSDIADDVGRILAETGLPPSCLRVEITESAAMKNAQQTLRTLGMLHAMDIAIDVDDFGTGYSSLSYLHQMPIHALKIDRGFVGPMCDDAMSRSIVQAIASLGHSLDLKVIAEGVESERHLQAVRAIGCDYVQGFHIGKPLSVEDATKFIAASDAQPLAASG